MAPMPAEAPVMSAVPLVMFVMSVLSQVNFDNASKLGLNIKVTLKNPQ
jgi:hypothetical protein